MMRFYFALLFLLCPLTLCLGQSSIPSASLQCPFESTNSGLARTSPQNYVPPTCTRVIQVNVHFILREKGDGNFNEWNDGYSYRKVSSNGPVDYYPDPTANGYAYAKGLISDMNQLCAWNEPLNNPSGVPSLDKKIAYTLAGVYFHRVDSIEYYANTGTYQGILDPNTLNRGDATLFNKYG